MFLCACTVAPAPGLADSDSPATKTAAVAALPDAPLPQNASSSTSQSSASGTAQGGTTPAPASNEGKQTKRILGIVPNFRSVSANTKLPPDTPKDKFKTALEDSFDYSAIIFAAGQAGVAQAQDSYPEFHQGAAGYGRYFWHTFADQTDENLWVEGILARGAASGQPLLHAGPWRFHQARFLFLHADRGHAHDAGNEVPNVLGNSRGGYVIEHLRVVLSECLPHLDQSRPTLADECHH